MSNTPGWVPIAALGVSALALGVAFLAFRAGGPRLRLKAARVAEGSANDKFSGGSTVRLTVVNAGRAAVTVQAFQVRPYGNIKAVVEVEEVAGPALPHRLDSHSSETWLVNALPAARAYDGLIRSGKLRPNSSWPSQFRFTVVAGNGKSAKTTQTFDSLRLIADAQRKP